jgi:hypothetical protein
VICVTLDSLRSHLDNEFQGAAVTIPGDLLTLGDFSPLVGETFRVHVDDGRESAFVLVEAKSLATPGAAPNPRRVREPFSLLFHGPGDVRLPQRIYRLEHRALGSREVFLVPVGVRDGGYDYEAIFA